MRKIVLVTMFVLFATSLMADIVFSGDARVRPRYDKIDTMDADSEIIKTTINTYWLYRARLNVNATIGEGYFFKGQIGHNAGAQWSKMGDATELPTGISNGSAQAPSLSWMLLNFGAKKDNYGWAIGRIGVPGHSLTDMHYYSSAMLDVPFVVNNNAAVTGGNIWINIGPGKLKGYLGNNVNNLNSLEDFVNDSLSTEANDAMTASMQYDIKVAGITLSPMFFYDMNGSTVNLLTYGALAKMKFAGIDFQAAFGMTSEIDDDTAEDFSANTIRLGAKKKLGPGVLNTYFDIASKSVTGGDEKAYNFLWMDYKYTVVKTDQGELSVKPTWRRYATDITDGAKSARNKFELTIEMKFK